MDIDVEGEGVLGFKLSRIRIIISMISAFRNFFFFPHPFPQFLRGPCIVIFV